MKRRVVTVLCLAMSAAAGCGTDSPTELAVPEVFDLDVDAAADVAPVDPERGDVLPADELLGAFERALAWHGTSLTQVMRLALTDDPDVHVWIDELVTNTADITAAVGLIYGPEGARAFNQQWAQHTQFLVDYAVARGANDRDAMDDAIAKLGDYAADSGSFFATATEGRLPADAVQGLLDTHVGHMVAMVNAEHDSEADKALDAALTDSAYLFDIAAGLVGAIVDQQPDVFPGTLTTDAALLCTIRAKDVSAVSLTELFGPRATDPTEQISRLLASLVATAN